MQTYQCFKRVQAMKIGKIEGCTLFPEGDGEPITVPTSYIARHPLHQPGYYVLYADGYESFSPADVFEGGYTLVTA